MKTASPGSTSLTNLNPNTSIATLSDATMYSTPCGVSCLPITSGRIPWGSLNARSPKLAIIETTAYAPLHRL